MHFTANPDNYIRPDCVKTVRGESLPASYPTGPANLMCRNMVRSDLLPLEDPYDRLLAFETGTRGAMLSLTYGG